MGGSGDVETPTVARIVAVAFAASFLFALPTSTASAATIEYANTTVTLPAGVSRVVTATCPAHTHVVGGGGQQFEASALSLYSSSTYPYDGRDSNSEPDDGWRVKYTTYDRPETVTAVAACADVLPHYGTVDYKVDTGVTFEQIVPCGGSREILSGGYRSVPTVRTWETIPHDGGESGDSWRLAMYNAGTGREAVTGFAICGGLDITYVYNPTDFGGDGPLPFWTVDATCPADHHTAIGGGFYTGNPTLRAYIHLQDNSPQIQSTFNFWRVTLDTSGLREDPAAEGWGICAASA